MLVLQSLARHALQDQDTAHHALARAVVLSAPERFIRTFVDAGPTVKLLLLELASLVATHQLTSLLTPHATPSGPARTAEEMAVLDYIHRLIAAFGPPLPAAQGEMEEGSASGGNALEGAATEGSVASAHGRRRASHPDRSEALINASLTRREIEVIHALARGAKNQVIAAELSITEPTVKRHVTHILSKLRARNRTQAVVTAIALGLIEPEITQFAESAEMRL
jgi:DNA-binding CsgD family transcriptional regulator